MLFLILFSCQQTVVAPVPSATPNPNNINSKDFVYLGKYIDKTLSGNIVKKDNINDLHFRYYNFFEKEVEIKNIKLTSSTNFTWETSKGNNWILAVEINNKIINTQKLDSLGKFSGELEFNFYASDSGADTYKLTVPGTEYTLQIVYLLDGNENKIEKKYKL
jgi:hypothetical protein